MGFISVGDSLKNGNRIFFCPGSCTANITAKENAERESFSNLPDLDELPQ
jgi:hypothetical protein